MNRRLEPSSLQAGTAADARGGRPAVTVFEGRSFPRLARLADSGAVGSVGIVRQA